MKTLALTGSILLTLAAAVSAQTWAEVRTFSADSATTLRLDAWLSGNIGRMGTFAWLQADKNYAQGYAGMSYSPKPWLQFGAGAGVESGSTGRFGSFLWAGNSRQSAIGIFEAGGSGPWWKAEYNRQISKQAGVGLITERYKGTGLRFQFAIPHTPLTVWGAPLLRKGRLAGLIGCRIKM